MSDEKDLGAIGQHCSLATCNRLDFLPVKCDLCEKIFCKDHYSITSHNCEKYTNSGEETSSQTPSKPFESYSCTFETCSNRERVQVTCEFCHKNFCMKHRLQIDHKCPHLDSNRIEHKSKAPQKEFKFELKQNVSEKNSALAIKLALMKLKQTAKGPPGLNEESKYYCFVYTDSSHPFFFSTKWPLGKCIEFAQSKINQPMSSNVRLFLNDKQLESSWTVEELVKNGTFSNQGLTLYLRSI